ncbi:MAG: choice-of-anchor P family protein [Bryobacteraceae bacterium]|jgi:hypothetical protein
MAEMVINITESARIFRSFRLPCAAALAGFLCCATVFGQSQTGYSGKALGTMVSVTPGTSGITAGSTAVSSLCTETAGMSSSNSVAGVSLLPLATTGVIDTSVTSAAVDNGTATTATATVSSINLLGGLITADGVQSVASAISSPGGFSTSSIGTTFTNAKVLGLPILTDIGPNTRITLPGIGFVILNEQTPTVTATSASMIVSAIHVKVSENNVLGLPIGTQLFVARAQSSTLFNADLLIGFAYGSSVSAGPIQAGRSADVNLGCTGTDQEETNSVAAVTVPGILTTGVVHTSAEGSVSSTGTSAQTTASVDELDLLSSLVAATTITAEANVSADGGAVTLSDTGSLFAGLVVTGHPEVGANPSPNTHVTIAGLGTLWLHRVIQTSTSIEVRMVELVVDTANSLGLPLGADVRIAVAHTGVVN